MRPTGPDEGDVLGRRLWQGAGAYRRPSREVTPPDRKERAGGGGGAHPCAEARLATNGATLGRGQGRSRDATSECRAGGGGVGARAGRGGGAHRCAQAGPPPQMAQRWGGQGLLARRRMASTAPTPAQRRAPPPISRRWGALPRRWRQQHRRPGQGTSGGDGGDKVCSPAAAAPASDDGGHGPPKNSLAAAATFCTCAGSTLQTKHTAEPKWSVKPVSSVAICRTALSCHGFAVL